ncbi:MAG: lysophospholipid acyltransferase family protein [Actinomycetota bacterium]|nr:lysophospholipid acyltransferase family protein [Actinomycetota bacterium]
MTPDASTVAAVRLAHRRVDRGLRFLMKFDIEQLTTPTNGPMIHAANHRSLADVLLAASTFNVWGRPVRPLVAASYFEHPVIGSLLRAMRCIPVMGAESLDLARDALEGGWSVAIMPEGRVVPREEWRELGVGKARSGLGRLALDTGLPVVVSGASGTENFWPRGRRFPHIRPWKRFPVALRSEYLGPVDAQRARDITEIVMATMERCVKTAEEATGIQR